MNDDYLHAFLDLPEAHTNGDGAGSSSDDDTYIWITRWEDFQHYPPERDRAPVWLKDYTKQDDDDDYRHLTFALRGLLASLRREFARSHCKLRYTPAESARRSRDDLATSQRRSRDDLVALTRRTGQRVRREHIEALNHAGFIELISRATLDTRLEEFYASRAPARSQRELLRSSKKDARRSPKKSGERASSENHVQHDPDPEPPRDPDAKAKLAAIAARIGEQP